MKKTALIVVTLVLVAGGGIFYFLRHQHPVRQDDYATYLPADTLAVISIRDLNGLVDRFPETPLGRFLAKENVAAMLAEIEAGPEALQEYNQAYDRIFSVLHNPGFRMVFGDDVDLALLPFSPAGLDGDPEKTLRESLVILATTASASTLKRIAGTTLHGQVESIEDNGVAMTRIRMDEARYLYAVSRDNRLLIGFTPAALHRCLAARNSGRHLAATENFGAALAFWQQPVRGKVHVREFVQIDVIVPLLSGSEDAAMREMGRYLRGMRLAAGQAVAQDRGWLNTSLCKYAYEQLDPAVRQLVDDANGKNITLHLLKNNPLLYSWSAGFDALSWLKDLQKRDPDRYRKWASSLRGDLGVSPEQTAASLGPQYGFSLEKIGQGGMFPLPRLVAFVQVRDRTVAGRLLAGIRKKIAARGVGGYREEQVDPYTLYSWTLLPGEATRPSYVLGADLLYVANNPDDLKNLLAVENERERLPEKVMERLGYFGDQVQQANNGVLLFWPHRFARQIRTAADWLAGLIASGKGIRVKRIKEEILTLLGATRLVVCTASLYPDHGVAALAFVAQEEKKRDER